MISKKSGVILNISSGAGRAGFSSLSAYCASKLGVGLPESLVLEVSEHQNI
jgi:short-subunit dehydrogenase